MCVVWLLGRKHATLSALAPAVPSLHLLSDAEGMRARATLIVLLVSNALAQPPLPKPQKPQKPPPLQKPQKLSPLQKSPAKDGASKLPPAIRKPTGAAAVKLGAFDAAKLDDLVLHAKALSKQLNQTIVAAERYAHTSSDKDVQTRTHIRFAKVLAELQKQWHTMSLQEHVSDYGVPLAEMTPAKSMAAAAKSAKKLPPMGAAPSTSSKDTKSMVKKLAPKTEPPPKPAPKSILTWSAFGRR